ncbi:DUF2285 domain-containing protein [Bradyrhizobium sp. RDT46]|uniref:DUF2285 domain-containing protein n=1 Tax=Bradyrhizobium sp. RDT46 TaxID=3341829 RepID=UPI0035C6769B
MLRTISSAIARELDLDTARTGADGLSVIYGRGETSIRLLLAHDAVPDQPVVAIVPLGADGLDRIDALTRLWRAVNDHQVPPDPRLTAQQRRRLRHMLQAVDGHAELASYREIAHALFGQRRVSETPWKTSALRDVTIDLVKDGLALIAGGYRMLLRRRRRH